MQFFRNSLLIEILGNAFNIGTYFGRSKTAPFQFFSHFGSGNALSAQNSRPGALESPCKLLRELLANGLNDLPREPTVDAARLKTGDQRGFSLRAPTEPRTHPLLGEPPVVEQSPGLQTIQAVSNNSLGELSLQQLSGKQESTVFGASEKLYRFLGRLVKEMRVAKRLDLGLVTGAAGGELEGFHQLSGHKKRGAV